MSTEESLTTAAGRQRKEYIEARRAAIREHHKEMSRLRDEVIWADFANLAERFVAKHPEVAFLQFHISDVWGAITLHFTIVDDKDRNSLFEDDDIMYNIRDMIESEYDESQLWGLSGKLLNLRDMAEWLPTQSV